MRVDPSGPVEEMAAGRAEIMTRAEIRALQQHRDRGYRETDGDDTLSASGMGADNVSIAPSEMTSAEWQLGSMGYPQKQVGRAEQSKANRYPTPLNPHPTIHSYLFLRRTYMLSQSYPTI